ncbi:unnamed protein product [Parnassius mnemosyne]|uniref:DDE-1 domain-containing protein n=1 Tax=Parnassius mnemosyne TaxID=213953 RepID=A0AAV1M166_9NEOP
MLELLLDSLSKRKSIVQALIAAGEYGCPLTKLDLRLTVLSFVIELCQDHNISFVFIPPNSTHLTQPLDVDFFAPLKKAWRKILLQYKMENPNQTAINKNHFPKLLTQLIKTIEINEVQNIKSGFRATGIYPFNPREVLKRIPECAEEMGNTHNIDSALLEYLKTTRQSKPLTSNRNRKVVVEPGKSVTVDDIQNRTKDTKKRSAKNKSAVIRSTAVQTAKNQKLNDTPSTASVGKENQILDQFKDELDFCDNFSLSFLADKNSVNENYTIDDIRNNDEYNINTYTTAHQALPTFTELDILDEKNGTLLSQITPTLCEINASSGIIIRECARTNIILKPNNHGLCEENTNLLKTEKQKPKIVSCVTIPSTKRTSNIIYQSDYDKENIETRQTIAKQNDFSFYIEQSRNISTKAEKIKKTKTSNVKLRPKKIIRKDFKVSKEKNMKGLKKKLKRRDSKSSNSDIDMSIHSDSDICGIVSDQDEPGSPLDTYYSNLSIGSENKVALGMVSTITKTSPNLCLNEPLVPVTVDHFSEPGPSTISTREEVSVEYKVGEYVLVRYFFTKKVDYYVGIILDKPKNGKLKVSFLRKVGKNDNSKFIKVKSPDIEVIDCKNIVKTVKLLAINDAETDFVLADDDDYIYFDY